jgi:FMN phosphatase YigB (HAD superfamily)
MPWFIDFDDTLSVGPVTWAFDHVFPTFIKQHELPYEPESFVVATLRAQQEANLGLGDLVVIDRFFANVNWPDSIKEPLLNTIFNEYRPQLFDDAIPFLERLKAQGQSIYLLSNNNSAPQLAEHMAIAHYFTGMFTPKSCGGLAGKPQRDMLDYVLTQHTMPDGELINMVGDDPWSDGSFADTCGLQSWLLDRMDRYQQLYPDKKYRWIKSLNEIV